MTLNLANLSPSLARIGRVRLYRSVAIAGRDGVHDLVVEGRRIVGIGTFARDEFPEGTVDIDAAGLTLSPGRAGGGTIADGTTTRIVSSLAGSAVSSGASGEMQNLATAVPPTDGPDPRGVIREHAVADLVLEDLLQNEGAPGRVCEVLVAGQIAYPAGQHNAGEIVLPLVARDDSVIPRVQRIGDCGHDRVRFGVVTGEAAGGVRALLGEADCDGVSVTTQVTAGAAEGFRIVVASDGVTLSAGSPAGLVRAAAALDQLRDADRTAPTGQWDGDAPRALVARPHAGCRSPLPTGQ